MRDGFILHEKTLKMIERLGAEDVQYLMACLTEYYMTGKINTDKVEEKSVAVALILDDALERMDADREAYEKLVEKRANAGRKGAEKRWQSHDVPMAKDGNAKNAIVKNAIAKKNMANDSGSVSVSVLKEKDNTSYYPKRNADCEALPLNDGTEWRPTEDEFKEFIRIYPAVNVRQEFASMRGWLIGNPTKRKTNRGIKRFVTSWLSRAQDKPKPTTNKWSAKVEQRDYDMDDLEARIMAVQ